MKKPLKNLLYAAILALPYSVSAQAFTETFGSVSSTSAVATASPGFVNTGFIYTTNASAPLADVRSTSPSTTGVNGYAGASGGANIFFGTQTPGGSFFEISGINTSALTGLSLSFGVSKNVNLADGSSLSVQISTDGINYTALSFPLLPTGTGSSHWYFRTCTGTIPSAANLHIRWTNTSTAVQFRIDDVNLGGGICTSSITSAGTTLCNGGGNATLTASPGASYLWSPGGFTTQSINPNQSATYNVTVTSASGCTSVAGPVRVLAYPAPIVGGNATSICGGGCSTVTARTFAPDLIISEYVEGSSNEKYVEIYNGTGATVNLSDYVYLAFHNGTVNPTFADTLSGTLNDGDVIVLQNNAAILYTSGITTTNVAHNGNDALAIYKISTASLVDIFGVIGFDPVSNWNAAGGYSTLDHTLRRKSTVYAGITVNPALPGQGGFSTLATEWDVFPINDVSGLGAHTMDASTYAWSAGTTPSTGKQTVACPEATTVYNVTGNYDFNGCSGTGTVQVNVGGAVTSAVDNGDAPVITTCYGLQCTNLTAQPLSGLAPFTYAWSTGATTSVAAVCPTVTSSYTVTTTDANGCSDTEVATIEVINACCGATGTNVVICSGTETLCIDSADVQSHIDGGASVGPCSGSGRLAAVKNNGSIKNNLSSLMVYPNPFAESTTLEIKLTESAPVKIEIMDITGKKIAELHNAALPAGTHQFNWNGNGSSGNTVVNGLYFCRIISGDNVQNVKIQKVSDK